MIIQIHFRITQWTLSWVCILFLPVYTYTLCNILKTVTYYEYLTPHGTLLRVTDSE